MPALPNQRHELFARGMADGLSAAAAYGAAGYVPHRQSAAALLTNPDVRSRIEELKGEAAAAAKFTKEQAIQFLVECIQQPVGSLTADSRLAEEISPTQHGTRVRMMGKAKALELLGKWAGWEKGTEAENRQADALQTAVKRLTHGQ